ncbi:hypothetical protein XENOCAPTIV_029694 [Xenoophorus captivus]|uniref:G-protein coupled receptor 125 n=1 Tax=Xenoophorus captivus TaxID=1517983 RepID=A0ABV0QYI4_9TELE
MISRIEPGAFLGLGALKKLDLSNNSISCLNGDIFKGLDSLSRLNLSGNMFSSLAQGLFDRLVSLKALEFQTPYLLCDCSLLWLPRWIKDRNVSVKNTKCSYPQSLQGQLIPSLRPELLTCDAPLELPSFQLTPSQRQVVFQGDSLPFQCQASLVAEDMQVLWYQNGRMVKPDATRGIFIEKRIVQNCSLIASALTISNIQPGFMGNWECRVRTSRGNTTRTVHIVVLQSSAKYCAPERVSNNKGEFRWPRTLAGIKAYLPCNLPPSSARAYTGILGDERQAWRYCNPEGLWGEEDYSQCQFQKEVTRFLHVINQMPLNETNVVTKARSLLVYTIDAANLSDKMDIIFMAEMIEKFGKFVEKFKDLGEVMVNMASNLMLADERVLWMAQREAMACTRIIACLQKIAVYRLATAQAFSLTSPNIALEALTVRVNDWNVMTCILFQRPSLERLHGQDRQLTFKCNTTGPFSTYLYKSTIVEASLQLPQSLFSQVVIPGQADDNVYKLYLLGFRNGKFFPSTGNISLLADGGRRKSVTTPVIMAKIGNSVGFCCCFSCDRRSVRVSRNCWMAWEPSIGAFYGPAGFIIFVDCMYFLSILLQLRRHPERRYELKESSEEQQHLASVSSEAGPEGPSSNSNPLTVQPQPNEASSSVASAAHAVALSALENEHTFSAQLIGAVGALGLYSVLWVFGAMAVSQDHPFDMAFSCLFGLTALALGAFMVAHHCVNRQDMRRFWLQVFCSGRRAYSAQEEVLLPQTGIAVMSTVTSDNKADGDSTKCGQSSADSSYTNRSAPSVRNSGNGSKLTNLHAEAAQCKAASAPVTANGTAVLDNSLTEHSLDNEIKMHVAPVEVQFHPLSNISDPTANGSTCRHQKNRARAHRASRLTVLREYAYDVPTSVEGSVQSAPNRRHHYYDMAARNSRRAAYMAYRERHQSQLQQDSSDSASLPRRSRFSEKGSGASLGNRTAVSIEAEQAVPSGSPAASKDAVRQPGSSEPESQSSKSYGLNLVPQNGGTLKKNGQAVPLMNGDGGCIKTGLWKHETTV